MPDILEVRPMNDSETDAVLELWTLCGLTRPWNDPVRDINFVRSCSTSDVLAGFCDGVLMASAMVGHDGHRGTAYYVSVHPDWQGKGYGKSLLEAIEQWLRERGIWKINLLVRADNLDVTAFYENNGYTNGNTIQLGKRLDN